MSRNKELAKNTFIIAIGKICTQFMSFLLLPIYTRFLKTEEFGALDLIITCTSLIAPIISLQLERSIFRYLIDARHDEGQQSKIITSALSSIVATSLLSAIVIPVVCIICGIGYAPLITALMIITVCTNALLQIPRGLGKNIHFSIAGIIIGVLNAAISIISTVALRCGIEGILLANIIANIAGIIYLVISTKLFSKIKMSNRDKKLLRKMLKFSIPMIPSDIVYWIISVSDRFLVALLLSSAANGIYATSVKIPTMIVTLYNIFNLSWIETVSVHIDDKDASTYISKTFSVITNIACSICCIATAAVPFIFNVIIGEDFSEAYNYIGILNIGAFFNIIIGALSAVYFGLKRTKDIAKSNIIAAILNIIINLALIKVIGIYAAEISTAIAYITVSIYRIIDIRRTAHIDIYLKKLIIPTLIIAMNTCLFMLNNRYLDVINIVLVVATTIFLNRTIIRKSYSIIEKETRRRKYARNN